MRTLHGEVDISAAGWQLSSISIGSCDFPGKCHMSIDVNAVQSRPVVRLVEMFSAEYASAGGLPAILNAIGACAGFSAQIAVWRELILPNNRNPGDFLVYVTTKSQEIFFFGEAINQFLLAANGQRVSFLSFAASELSDASQLPDIAELLGRVAGSLGSDGFGRPRPLPSIEPYELPRAALGRTWVKTAQILADARASEWPALLGATAQRFIQENRRSLTPTIAVQIMLEAAAPMSKLNPATVEGAGVPAPAFANWSMRALRPENGQAIMAEVVSAMPPMPVGVATQPLTIEQPKIVFLNLAGAACEAIVREDRAQIGELFKPNVEVTTAPVRCDVLFLYCEFESPGKIFGQSRPLGELIRASDAQIVVIASEVPAAFMGDREFSASLSSGDFPPVNLVMTLGRHGKAFGRFFVALFELMWAGKSMPMAYVQLAPQVPAHLQPPRRGDEEDIPGTIFAAGRGQVGFAPRAQPRWRDRISTVFGRKPRPN
jgi:hypothetical protein